MPVSYKIKDSSAGILFDRLKAYISGSHSLVREFFIRLGNLKTVRILTYYPGTAGILAREFGWSLIPPVAHPDATIRLWQETGCRDFVSRVLGLDPGQVIEGESWTELIRCAPDGELYPMGTIDSDGPWGVHMSLGNEYFYGLDGLEEAKAYLADPLLKARLLEISGALLDQETLLFRARGGWGHAASWNVSPMAISRW